MSNSDFITFTVAMIIMMNPLGSLSVFLQLTKSYRRPEQKKTAVAAALAMATIMLITLWLGEEMLHLFGITLSAFRCAGGLILLLMGLSMLQSQESPVSHTQADDIAAKNQDSIAVVPLALPLVVGPGAMSTIIIYAGDASALYDKISMAFICLLLAAGMGVILLFGHSIARFVGQSVIKVVTRIMGMIIMAIAVEMLANGILGFVPA